MYHALTEKDSDLANPVHISFSLFTKQMEWLKDNGYRSILLDELPEIISAAGVNDKLFVLTFDDGYSSLYKYAMPLLKKLEFKAVLYLSVNCIDKKDFTDLKDIQQSSLPVNDRPLTWNEVKEMRLNGWSVQSHSMSHADHSSIDTKQLIKEVFESKINIEFHLHEPVTHYAYPFGKYDTRSIDLVKQAGYMTAVSVHPGLCDNRSDQYRLPRLEMNRYDTLETFIKKVETGFKTPAEKRRSALRRILFSNLKIKDFIKRIAGNRIN